jgi:hypothetical protein
VVVQSEVRGKGEPIKLDYRLDKDGDGWKIIDVNVGGIWLVTSYRSQFAQEIKQRRHRRPDRQAGRAQQGRRVGARAEARRLPHEACRAAGHGWQAPAGSATLEVDAALAAAVTRRLQVDASALPTSTPRRSRCCCTRSVPRAQARLRAAAAHRAPRPSCMRPGRALRRGELLPLPARGVAAQRRFFLISCSIGRSALLPSRRATPVVRMSMIIRCSRRDTIGL